MLIKMIEIDDTNLRFLIYLIENYAGGFLTNARWWRVYRPSISLQITVSCVRRQLTTKQQYETETPGMVGLPADQLQDLQRKLMAKISKKTCMQWCTAELLQKIQYISAALERIFAFDH